MATNSDSAVSVVVPQALKASARRFYLENAAMNRAKKTSEAERKKLFAELEVAGISEFSFETTDEGGGKLRLNVEVKTPDAEWIDVGVLKELVTEEQFMAIVTASKKAVEEKADKAIAARATHVEVGGGTRNVFVKPAA